MKNRFRFEIENMIESDDLSGLLQEAGKLHGHHCNYLSYGIVAGLYCIKKLGITNTGMEEIIAIVETNNCFSDGIQMVTGCSFGNNALIFRDYGKTAVTVSKRDGRAVRLVLQPEFEDSRENEYPEAYELFNKFVVQREQGNPADLAKMMELFAEMSSKELNMKAETIFKIEEKKIGVPDFAPVFESVQCTKCGENVMRSRAIEKEGSHYCTPCAREPFFELNGSGIVYRNQ